MYQYRTRDYDYEQGNGSLYYSGASVADYVKSNFPWMTGSTYMNRLPFTYFEAPEFDYGKFLGGDYSMGTPVNFGLMWQVLGLLKKYGSR
jgi:hypothetical protein